ncbi:zinc finger MYM-type protein 6 [Trichonephila clavipes]|nr:zinc finger MYM-type protein 6 [Trichonephila clavipes]
MILFPVELMISEDVEQQLFGKLRDKLFSIQLDEATDSNKDAHFIAHVRFWDGMSEVEELHFCKPIKFKARAIALFDILNNFINEANIEWKNCVGICIDGARTMSGRFKCIQALLKQKSPLCIWTHCMIHREALASKEMSPDLNIRGCGSPVVKVSNHGRHVMSSIPVPLKTRRVGQRCTLNLSRAETSSRRYGVVVRRGGASSGVVHVT